MERTSEFQSILKLHNVEINPNPGNNISDAISIATKILSNLNGNESLLNRMSKLVLRKEFSNDPTTEIADISDIFQLKLVSIQKELQIFKKYFDNENKCQGHKLLHYRLIYDILLKKSTAQFESFQTSVKTHSEHVQQRKKRVIKYGHDSISTAYHPTTTTNNNITTTQSYALFNHVNNTSTNGSTSNKSLDLRRRSTSNKNNTTIIPSPYDNNNEINKEHNLPIQKQKLVTRNDSRLKNAEKIETSIAQMGKLFIQMATLVKEQSNTIMRIEDDVEAGLQDTTEAHSSMMKVYDITKGNRSMILKIFLLLVFFIFLFLVWT